MKATFEIQPVSAGEGGTRLGRRKISNPAGGGSCGHGRITIHSVTGSHRSAGLDISRCDDDRRFSSARRPPDKQVGFAFREEK